MLTDFASMRLVSISYHPGDLSQTPLLLAGDHKAVIKLLLEQAID